MTDSRRKDDGVATDGVAPDSVTLAETVRVSQSRAFELFTEHVSDWYLIGQHTVPNFERTVRLRFEGPGGRFLAVTDPDTGDGDVLGEIETWDPPASPPFIIMVAAAVSFAASCGVRLASGCIMPVTLASSAMACWAPVCCS